MIVFTNPGEIDVRSITTFGVSVKEGENPIGFFGTGLKYAIAVLLRTGHIVEIYSGIKKYKFDVSATEVRGTDFDLVTISADGQEPTEIGFTTQLGKQWELWAAYREIACNCKDEQGEGTYENDAPIPKAGFTTVVVHGTDFETVFAKRHEYILEDEPDLVVGTMEIRLRPSMDYYYRDIRVSRLDTPSLFTYNDLQTIILTEDRTMKHEHYIGYHVSDAILSSNDANMIRKCVLAKDVFEERINYDLGYTPSATFIEVVGSMIKDKLCTVNVSAVSAWKKATRGVISPDQIVLTKVQVQMLEKALTFVATIGFQVRDVYPIIFVESLGDGVLGLAKDDKIYIAERVLHQGTKALASTLIEEYLHLKQGYKDCTYEMQTFLFDKIVSLGEEMNGEPL